MEGVWWTPRARRVRSAGAVIAASLVMAGCLKDRGHPPGTDYLYVSDVNASGEILVFASTNGQDTPYILEPDNDWVSIPPPATWVASVPEPAQTLAHPQAITDDGIALLNFQITTADGTGVHGPVLWDAVNGTRDIESLIGQPVSSASDISDSGYVVGQADDGGGWVWNMHTDSVSVLQPVPGESNSLPQAVNDSGWVVGQTNAWDGTSPVAVMHPVLWAPPLYEPVVLAHDGTDFGYAGGIDDDGTIIGSIAEASPDGAIRAVIWDNSPTHSLHYLDENPDPTLQQSSAADIDDGVIVGFEVVCVIAASPCPFDNQVTTSVAWNASTLDRTLLYGPPDTPALTAIDGDHLAGHRTQFSEDEWVTSVVSRGRPKV